MKDTIFKPGIRHTHQFTVNEKELASSLFHNDINYITTSSLILRMEQTTIELLKEKLPEDMISISVEINAKHILKAKLNEELTCSVHLKFAEDNKLFFDFAFFNKGKELIAIGAHERKIISKNQFIA